MADQTPSDNPYAAPLASGPAPLEFEADTTSEKALLRAFVGPRSDYYLGKWNSALTKGGGVVGFNWMACLFSGFWFPYRKMYVPALGLYGFILATAVAEITAQMLWDFELPSVVDNALNVSIAIVCGAAANGLYLKQARKALARAQQQGFTGTELMEVLAKRGGTSWLTGLGMLVLFLGAVIILAVVVALILIDEAALLEAK